MADFKIFNLWDVKEVVVNDAGLKRVINLDPKLVLKSHGRHTREFGKTKVNVVERLITHLQIPGTRGKKHRIMTSWTTGKYSKNAKIVIDALKMIEEKTKQNPVAVLVRAIENASPRDEVTSIEYGGARYPQSVDISPLRRLNLALRYFTQGAYDKAFNKKATMTECLAKEIMLAAEANGESFAMNKKNDLEKQADAAR